MDKKYSKKGLVLVAPECQGSSNEDILAMASAKKMKYAITKNISGPSIGVTGIPRMAVFDTSGKLVFAGRPGDDADKAIKTALKGVKEDSSSSSSSALSIFDKKKDLVAQRKWTNSEGKVITATLISLDKETGNFKFPNGKTFKYDIKMLSEADQEVIKEAAEALASDSEEEAE